MHGLVCSIGEIDSASVVLAHEDYIKSPFPQHSGKRALALADLQCLCLLIPSNWYSRVVTLLIVVAVILVFVEREPSIGATINAQLDWIGRLLRCILQFRAHRDDGTCANIQ